MRPALHRPAARTFQNDCRNTGRCLQFGQQLASACARHLRTGKNDRMFGGRKEAENFGAIVIVKRLVRRCVSRRPNDDTLVEPRIEQIRRQAQMHRPAPAGARDAEGFAEVAAQRVGGAHHPRRLCYRFRHLGLAQFLESAAAKLPGGRVTGQQHHWRLRGERGEQGADRIGMTRTASDQADANLAGQPTLGVRHMHGGGFMADMHEVDADVECGIKDRHDVVARQREDAAAAEPNKGASDDIGAA